MKRHDQKQVGKERVYSVHTSTSLSITEGSRDRNSNKVGTWRQELVQRTQKDAAYWLAPPGLFYLHFYRTQDHLPRDNPTHIGPIQTLINKMPYKPAYSLISLRHFLNGGFFLSIDSSLC